MHRVVADALVAVGDDCAALSVARLPGLAAEIAVLKRADAWIAARILDEAPAAAYRLAVAVVPARDAVIDSLVSAIRVRLAGLAVDVRVGRQVEAERLVQEAARIGARVAAVGGWSFGKLVSAAVRKAARDRVSCRVLGHSVSVRDDEGVERLA